MKALSRLWQLPGSPRAGPISMPGIACLPVLFVVVIIRCAITHTSLECPALDAPGPPPGDGHLQAGLIAVATYLKAAFNALLFIPCAV